MTIQLRQWRVGLILLGLLAVEPVHAQDIHVGFVKTDRIFKEAAAAKVAQTKLTQEFSTREKDILDREAAFKSAVDKFQIEAPTLPESQRIASQRRLADRNRELQLLRRNFQDDLNARKNDELHHLLESANKIIKKIAETEKYDIIFQDAVYVNPKYDMTDNVLKALNAQADK